MFFSNSVPIELSGSFVIFRRHLLPLVQEGWALTILSYFDPPESGEVFWRHVRLPLRKWYWPPVLRWSPTMMRLRTRIVARYLLNTGALAGPVPHVLLANLWDTQALLAGTLARARFGRLGAFMHDDEVHWNETLESRRYLKWKRHEILRAATRVWPVSTRLTATLPSRVREKCRLLRPIPGNISDPAPQWHADREHDLHIGYSGKVYPGFWDVLVQLANGLVSAGGRLTVITHPDTVRQCSASCPANVTIRSYFRTAMESACWLQQNCSVLVVGYPSARALSVDRWGMLQSSFPSKLTEYAQLGLPLLLIGDRDSEFGDWGTAQTYLPFFDVTELSSLLTYAKQLTQRSAWENATAAVQQMARTEFDPAKMQEQFASDIRALAFS